MTEITDLSSPVLWLIVGLLWGSMLTVIIREHWSRTRDAIERELERARQATEAWRASHPERTTR